LIEVSTARFNTPWFPFVDRICGVLMLLKVGQSSPNPFFSLSGV
jgi:hypothetical protein